MKSGDGFTYSKVIKFWTPKKKAKITITGDTFEWIIKDDSLVTVATLTIGAGLEITDTYILRWTLGAPLTDAPGTYTHELIWIRTATGEKFPIAAGTIEIV